MVEGSPKRGMNVAPPRKVSDLMEEHIYLTQAEEEELNAESLGEKIELIASPRSSILVS